MNKVAVVFWSGTGNTEAMANAIAEGAKSVGAEVDLMGTSEFDTDKVSAYSSIAFGCPCTGSEQLEDGEFEPMWDSVKNHLDGKAIYLFGSYGWGDGEWMRNWESEAPCRIVETYICNGTPGDDELTICKELGTKMAQ